MKTNFCIEFMAAAKDGPRLFFAPLVGAIEAMQAEANRIAQEKTPTKIGEKSKQSKRSRGHK